MSITNYTELVEISTIIVERSERQRKELPERDQASLVGSIRRNGLINPIIVARDGLVLKAGERRLEACKALGWSQILVRWAEDLSDIDSQILELEENLKRLDLDWQDQVRSIGRIHKLFQAKDLDWTMGETAAECNLTLGTVSMYLKVFAELGEERILTAGTVREAYNTLGRRDARAAGEALQEILETTQEMMERPLPAAAPLAEETAPGPGTTIAGPIGGGSNVVKLDPKPFGPGRVSPVEQTILHETFPKWVEKYKGKPFNLVHCDFPYGIELFAGPQAGGERHGQYGDSKDLYFQLLSCLLQNINKIMSNSGHMVFWFGGHEDETRRMFQDLAPSLVVWKHKLIWHKSDNAGIASNATMGPRHVYEQALLVSRGNRQIVRVVADLYPCPTDKRFHVSTKPEPMLKHFFSMLVDENTSLFDPTCGGGSAIRVAEELGAARCLGMDIDEQVVGTARVALRNARTLRVGTKGML